LGTESIIFFGRLPPILTLLPLMAVVEVEEMVLQELQGQKEPLDLQALLENKALLEPLVLLEMLELLV
jgi:hypothetical protein